MEKKQKITMKKLQFVIVIALGSNTPGVIIRGKCNSPKWELSGGIIQEAIVLGRDCPVGNCLMGQLFLVAIVWGTILQGEVIQGQLSRRQWL